MKSKSLQRALLLASGICAVLVILLSQSFYEGASTPANDTAGKSKEKKEVAIHAPSDVTVQGHVVEISPSQPNVEEDLKFEDYTKAEAVFVQKVATDFFNTLFRVIISPNAP